MRNDKAYVDKKLFSKKTLYIAVDFDGTIVKQDYPEIGDPVPLAIETLIELDKLGHHIILWTCRDDEYLYDALDYLSDKGVNLYCVNNNFKEADWNTGPKAFAHIYIDDLNLGIPTMKDSKSKHPYVDWEIVRDILKVKYKIPLGDLHD